MHTQTPPPHTHTHTAAGQLPCTEPCWGDHKAGSGQGHFTKSRTLHQKSSFYRIYTSQTIWGTKDSALMTGVCPTLLGGLSPTCLSWTLILIPSHSSMLVGGNWYTQESGPEQAKGPWISCNARDELVLWGIKRSEPTHLCSVCSGITREILRFQ